MKKPARYFIMLFLTCFSFTFAQAEKEEALARGYCGDGVINGNEDCDGNDIKIRSCKTLNGGEGEIQCQANCVYDISKCGTTTHQLKSIVDLVDERLGGVAEECKCNCSGNSCDGGCAQLGIGIGVSRCLYRCEQNCVCNCGELLQAHVERCDFECSCQLDRSGNPQCICKQDQCDLITSMKPNIGTLANLRHPFMTVH